MNILLTPELEQYINQKVETGLYHTASEVVREGLRLLKERDELHQRTLEALRREVQVGIDQADRGETTTLTREVIEDIKARGRKRRAERAGQNPS